MEGYHSSVLLKEAVDALIAKQQTCFIPARLNQDGLATAGGNAWYLDCTLGDGGHSIEIIRRGGKVVGIDADPQALERVRKRFKDLGIEEEKYKLVQGNFRDIDNLLSSQADTVESKFDGAIFDLGVSSLQLETPERGFSFGKLGPLDMRMDPSLQVMALDLLNTLTRKELYALFSSLGEEKYSWRLANALVSARAVAPITDTLELARIVEEAIGGRREKIHPATRVFQALRMTVNDELGALQEGLDQIKEIIEKNGHIVVISFHSLEDRIVKRIFKQWELGGMGKVLTKKPVVPTEAEIEENPRSRSAKMRVFEKI